MPLLVVPTAIPTMEPVVNAGIAALESYMTDSLAVIQSKMGDNDILPPVQEYSPALITAYQQITKWPTITVTASGPSCVEADEQGGHQFWRGELTFIAFLMNSSIPLLERYLYRYAAAIWLSLVQVDDLAGALLDYATMDFLRVEGTNATATARAYGFSVDALFRT